MPDINGISSMASAKAYRKAANVIKASAENKM